MNPNSSPCNTPTNFFRCATKIVAHPDFFVGVLQTEIPFHSPQIHIKKGPPFTGRPLFRIRYRLVDFDDAVLGEAPELVVVGDLQEYLFTGSGEIVGILRMGRNHFFLLYQPQLDLR
jgi:hypothetical protein